MTLYWMTAKDYMQVAKYKKLDLLHKQKISLSKALMQITWVKAFYYGYILVLPLLFSGQAWYFVVAGFVLMHLTAGLFLACVFQPSHILATSSFKSPVGDSRRMEDSWAVHELATTSNFAPRSRILSWFIGGLNFQIEHHLFSNICHVHYKKLAPLVKETAASFGLPYNVQPTFFKALRMHAGMLKQLGRQ